MSHAGMPHALGRGRRRRVRSCARSRRTRRSQRWGSWTSTIRHASAAGGRHVCTSCLFCLALALLTMH